MHEQRRGVIGCQQTASQSAQPTTESDEELNGRRAQRWKRHLCKPSVSTQFIDLYLYILKNTLSQVIFVLIRIHTLFLSKKHALPLFEYYIEVFISHSILLFSFSLVSEMSIFYLILLLLLSSFGNVNIAPLKRKNCDFVCMMFRFAKKTTRKV